MSQSRRSLDPALIEALTREVQTRLPAGEPLTLDALENAILGIFQDLGSGVKKAHRLCMHLFSQNERNFPAPGELEKIKPALSRASRPRFEPRLLCKEV